MIQPEIPSTLRVFVVCDQDATAPIWGYIIREKGLVAILETSVQRAMGRAAEEQADLIVVDVNASHSQRMELCQRLRSMSQSPILLFMPTNNENEILEAYQLGVDECVIKPISPAIFLAKIMAWARRSRREPVHLPASPHLALDPARRVLIGPANRPVKLTHLEFRLLHLLMSRPGYVFQTEEIIPAVWGERRKGDTVLLKNIVYRLRKKLSEQAEQPNVIHTWPGGYSFLES
ncbi:MAG: response regulator transcription factor [Anaerolineae bacterium]